MKKFFKTMTMLVVLVSLAALPAIGVAKEYTTGEEVKKEERKELELDEMVVKARKIEERLSAELGEIGHPVEIITGEEIKKAGFVDISAAIEAMVPGYFSVTKTGRGDYHYPSLHGSDKILWLLDGVRINNRLYGKGYLDTISVHMIDRIEILKGGEGLFYGTEARAGVVNIITKGITTETSGEFGTSYGRFEYREVYGNVTETFNGHGLMAFGSHEGWDGYQVFDDQAYSDALNNDKKPRRFDRTTLGAKYRKEFEITGRGVLRAQLQKQQGKFDYMRPNERKAVNDREEEIGILKWDHDINENFSYYLKSYFHRWWTDYTRVKLDGSYVYNEALWGYEDYGVNFLTSTRWGGGHEILAGIDYQNYRGKDEVVIINGEHEEVFGFFGLYKPYLPFSPNTGLALGARYNKTGEADSTIWSVSMKTPVIGETYFRGMVGTSFALANANQLYADDPWGIGNPDLDPEESLNVEVGAGGNWRYFQCDAGYFYHKVTDRIALNADTNIFENVDGKTKIDGVEIQAGIGPFRGLLFNVSATWIDAEDEDTGEHLEKVPEFHAKANFQYRYPTGQFGADLMTRYAGDIYERGLGAFDDVKYGDYYIADVSGFVKFGKDKRHKLTLRVENIFDEEYATCYSRGTNDSDDLFLYHFEGLPRNVVLGYTYTF